MADEALQLTMAGKHKETKRSAFVNLWGPKCATAAFSLIVISVSFAVAVIYVETRLAQQEKFFSDMIEKMQRDCNTQLTEVMVSIIFRKVPLLYVSLTPCMFEV